LLHGILVEMVQVNFIGQVIWSGDEKALCEHGADA
jgi:hypothetical protein